MQLAIPYQFNFWFLLNITAYRTLHVCSACHGQRIIDKAHDDWCGPASSSICVDSDTLSNNCDHVNIN